MNLSNTLVHRLAMVLLAGAKWFLPRAKNDWARAMQSELHYVKRDRRAILWALGCLNAAVKYRAQAMITADLKISRCVLASEMLLCFVPLCVAWLDSLFGVSGFISMNTDVFQRHFVFVPGGWLILAVTIVGVLGPVGLVVSFRQIALRHCLECFWLRAALIAGPVLLGALQIVIDSAGFRANAVDAFDSWTGLLLIAVLPAAGAAHLVFVSIGQSEKTAPA